MLPNLNDAPIEDRLAFVISAVAKEFPDRVAIVNNAGTELRYEVTYASLASMLERLEQSLDEHRPVGVIARGNRLESLIAIAAACGRQHIPLAFLAEDARDLVGQLRDWMTLDDILELAKSSELRLHSAFEPVPSNVIVATSGTSGPPRLVEHSWDSLLASARLAEQWHGLGWFLFYDATRWAGMQVWLQSVLTGGRLVVPDSRNPNVALRAIIEEKVSILPGTPGFLRKLISSGNQNLLADARVSRITLGGEVADEALLTKLHQIFPSAKLSHVYATTELGEVFRVNDGRPGFPAKWLGHALPSGGRLSCRRDGELLVQLSRDSAEVGTGDLIERVGDRFVFTGRRSDIIMVGDAKVFPDQIEQVLRGVPGVVDARAYGLPSAITGEMVAAEIVLADPLQEKTPETVRADALSSCQQSLEQQAVPKILDIVNSITTIPAGKTTRRRSL